MMTFGDFLSAYDTHKGKETINANNLIQFSM